MATATAMPPRRRHAATGAAAGEWAAVSTSGEWRSEAIGKHQLVRRTGLSARDLRALDPALSYPSSVMGRDRAIVVNLDRVRAVITASEALVPGPRDPSVAPLVAELRARLAAASPAPPRAVSDGEAGKDGGVSPPRGGGGKVLPFEFRALEVCLEYACKSLEHETSMLEKEAYPALDALTSRVSTLNLEHVRQIKCRLVAISGGVHKVRDELEHLLDDDADMAAMHLSEKAAFQAASQSSRFDIGTELVEIDEDGDDDETEAEQGSMAFMPKIDELENLLEAYFVQIDGTLNKLSAREYVEDTEDYINIMLDDKQNQLLQMGVVLSTVTLLITSAVVVTAVFGMNIHIALYRITDFNVFWEAVGGTLAGAATLFVVAMLYYWKNGILR
ncbi:putative magnesium transporter MRS2-D isoform X2 [Miscanthus floridulus]|uniref:putative magnesium transporter MRS2-D isoform X2 n=1 Tax=Miscanthus floridulus TaxID=154761 RepID=UPI0034578C14